MKMMTNIFNLLTVLFLLHSLPSILSSPIKTFNVVTNFGANNAGMIDSTVPFLNAWKAACTSLEPSEIYVPNGKYLLKPIDFEGGCKSSILFRIDGTLIANHFYSNEHWLRFHQVDGLQIKGGVLDAKGRKLWHCKGRHKQCPNGAKSLNFDNSRNIVVDGLTSMNSQMFHIGIDTCQNVKMQSITITAYGESPNTDGIHLQKSEDISILQSKFMTGDDCISIGPHNKNIWIQNVFCGPGHGISIGSLGRDSDEGVVVQNVTVKSTTFVGTQNGLRIKTFSTPVHGSVSDIYFVGATMTNVQNPIIIDQNYCPHGQCSDGQGSGIQISNVLYKDIHGTSSTQEIVTFDCSPTRPCNGLTLEDINLSYKTNTPICESKNAHWEVKGFMQPSNCLGH